jgi:uncharacterized membrane protein YbhN (UPF0104 family)
MRRPALDHFGAPLDAALAGTLVYRDISLLLPVATGFLTLAHTSLRRRGEHPHATGDRSEPG